MYKPLSLRVLLFIPLLTLLVSATAGCKKEKRTVVPAVSDISEEPTMSTRNVETLISDSGYTRYRITTPIWLIYDNIEEPKWRFPEGLDLQKYDKDMKPDSRIVCDSATYFSQKKIWRLDGNVRMRNTAGDKFLTQQLFWDQMTRRIYSDSFIHIERSDRILEGHGFVSNEQMSAYSISRPSGIFPVPERKDRNEDSNEPPVEPEPVKQQP